MSTAGRLGRATGETKEFAGLTFLFGRLARGRQKRADVRAMDEKWTHLPSV